MKYLLLIWCCCSTPCAYAQNTNAADRDLKTADSLFNVGNWKAAGTAYAESVKSDSKNGRAWYRLAACYQNESMYKEAIDAYLKSLQYKSPIPPFFIQVSLSKVYAIVRDSANALKTLSELIDGGYGNFPDMDSAKEYKWMRSSSRFGMLRMKAEQNAFPCINNPQNREFDFWIGKWDVFQTGTDYQVGKSIIENPEGGCMIIENWTATGPPSFGKSMNFIQPKTNKWEQVWMGSGGAYLNYYNGVYKDGAMRYEGNGINKKGDQVLFHLTYFNINKNEVRQLLEQSFDRGNTWNTLYDFTYRRI
jgi:hypothetical protein